MSLSSAPSFGQRDDHDEVFGYDRRGDLLGRQHQTVDRQHLSAGLHVIDWNSVRTVTVTGVADNLSDGDQAYAIQLSGDSSPSDLRFANVDPEDVSVRNLDYTAKGGFYVSQISGDTDENLKTATFTVSLSSAPSSDNVTVTMASSDTTEGGSPDLTTTDRQHLATSSDWNSVRTVTVTGVADNLSDGDQAYAIQLSGDSSRRICALRMWILKM